MPNPLLARLAGLILGAWIGVAGAQPAPPAHPIEEASAAARTVGRNARFAAWAFGDYGERVVRRAAAESLSRLNDFDHAAPHWQRLATLYARAGRAADYASVLHADTEAAIFRGDYDSAQRYKLAELEIGQRYELPAAQARAEAGLGVIARRRGKLDEAIAHFERALQLRQTIGDRYGQADTLVQLATAKRNLGDYTHALDLLQRSLELRNALGPAARRDLTLRALGVLYGEVEDYPKAKAALEQALAAAEPTRDALAVSPILGSLAALYNDQGLPNQALAMAQRALAIDDAYRNVSGIELDALEAARALLALGRYDEADRELDRVLELARRMGQEVVVARVELYRALGLEARGRNDPALALLDAAGRQFKSEDQRPFLLQTLAASARILAARGSFEQAHEIERQRAELREKLLGAQSSRRLAGVIAEYQQQQQKQQIALLTKDNELQALRIANEELRRNVGVGTIAVLLALLALVSRRYAAARRHATELAQRNAQIEAQRQALAAANAELEKRGKALYQAAISDPLTGVFHRGHLLQLLREEVPRALSTRTELALLLVDFDFFKKVNDSYGHALGDRVLVAGVERIRTALDGIGFFGRYGGEEFLVVLPGAGHERAVEIAERLRHAIADSLSIIEGISVAQTISIGVATLDQAPAPTEDALLGAADEALYAAKARGRNCVAVYPVAGGTPFLRPLDHAHG